MSLAALQQAVERLAGQAEPPRDEALAVVALLFDSLESGVARAAEPQQGGWIVHRWVKQGILLGFRIGRNRALDLPPVFHFVDRDTFLPLDPGRCADGVRVVPGGTTVRRGSFLAEGVVVMPPSYVNVGAHVARGSMIDSHVLVGTCAQIGERVHLSAAVQIGGVLEPAGALPVIVEDEVFVGGGCGLYEGVRVGAGAVLAPGVILTRAVPVYDLEHGRIYRAAAGAPLTIPPRAVVVPGSRPVRGEFAERQGLHLAAPVIVKYRDPGTDAALVLEGLLR